MPMLSVVFPSNAEYFISFLVDIVNFNIIPTDKVIDKIMKLKASSDGEVDKKFGKFGFKSTNVLKNLGFVFIALLGFVFVILIVLAVKRVA
jgi:hypothetical protein